MNRRQKPRDVSEAEERQRLEKAPEGADHGITEKRTGKRTTNTISNMPASGNEQEGRGMGRGQSTRVGRKRSSASAGTKARQSASGRKKA
jgi:hypothetical protein